MYRHSCICSNKDKNFKANHNNLSGILILRLVVSVVTKIRILKQITTYSALMPLYDSCICSNKDKNFKANHNDTYVNNLKNPVVSVVTKIRILKQITTCDGAESSYKRCICSNKDKNFKANHNSFLNLRFMKKLYL